MKIQVMTYNIRLGIQQGVEGIASVIREADPDIVALQEVGRHWIMGPSGDTLARLGRLCRLEFGAYAPCIRSLGAHYGHGLLSRWPIEAPRFIELIRDVDEERAALVSRVTFEGGSIEVLSTHLSHVSDRHEQGPELAALAVGLGKPSLVLGDLNEDEEPEWLQELMASHADAFDVPLPTFPAQAPERRIDFLLGRGGEWRDARVLDNDDASDHRAVTAAFVL